VALAWRYNDTALRWFAALFTARYYRFFVNLYAYWRYKPSPIPDKPTLFAKDVTLILPTVSVSNNPDFEETVTTFLVNKPARFIIVMDTYETLLLAIEKYRDICAKIQAGSSPFLSGLGPMDVSCVRASFLHTGHADKRTQMARAIPLVQTKLTVFLDDHVFVKPKFLQSVLAAFEDPHIGICGTKKSVRRKVFRTGSILRDAWLSVWNFLGIAYLVRHSLENQLMNSMDGGVAVVSGRTMAIRTALIKTNKFLKRFVNQKPFLGSGRVKIGDDNFITMWVVKQNYGIKMQCTEDATIETTLGEPFKFFWQCLRWRRTTYQANIEQLLTNRKVWKRWPWTVWMALIPALFNLALFWDAWMVYAFTQTTVYSRTGVSGLITWIYLTKVVKLLPHFLNHPWDFVLFFFPLPVHLCWAYIHSFISIYSIFTIWNQRWEGRCLDNATRTASAVRRRRTPRRMGMCSGRARRQGSRRWRYHRPQSFA